MEGQVENLGMERTRGEKPPAASKAWEKVGELWSMSIMRRRAALVLASSWDPSRTQANQTGVSIPAKAERKAWACWCFNCWEASWCGWERDFLRAMMEVAKWY